MTAAGTRDIRTLLWMDRPIALIAVVVLCLSTALRSLTYLHEVSLVWPIVLALTLVTVGAVAIVAVPGDPLPIPVTLALTVLGPVTSLLVLPQLHTHNWIMSDIWHLRVVTVILCFVSVRGRPWFAAVGATANVAVFTIWMTLTDQGWISGVRLSLIIFAPVFVSLFVAAAVRPMAQMVFALRERESDRASDEAMAAVSVTERERQLASLDETTRPLLEAAAAGAHFDAAARERCALLEERLRDTLRAPVFASDDTLRRATAAARRRGTRVILLDEGGLTDENLADAVRVALIDELDATAGGTVTARALPEGRATSATIVIEIGDRVRRVEFDSHGRVRAEVRNGDVPDLDYQAVQFIVRA